MRFPWKKHIVELVLALVLSGYVISYFIVRQHRLSVEFVGKTMLFSSQEDAQEWIDEFPKEQKECDLIYDDNRLLYMFFWPVIQLDSKISGYRIVSPFGVTPYRVPENSGSLKPVPVRDHSDINSEE